MYLRNIQMKILKAYSHVMYTFTSPSKLNIVPIATQILMLRISLCLCVTIDAILNFDGDVDANADVKCEQSGMLTLHQMQIFISNLCANFCLGIVSLKFYPLISRKTFRTATIVY